MPTVTLREIDKSNYIDMLRLKVRDDQEGFVATNCKSLVQAHYEDNAYPFGVYAGDKAVGFVMVGNFDAEGYIVWFVWRLMVDAEQQGKGYGRGAMIAIIDWLKAKDLDGVLISFVPENVGARKLYENLGFIDEGMTAGIEVLMRLPFKEEYR